MEDWAKEELDTRANDRKIHCKNDKGETEEIECVYPASIMVATFGEIKNADCQRKVIESINAQNDLVLCLDKIYDDLDKEFGFGHVLLLYYQENKTINEIAKLTRKKPEKIYDLILAGLQKLRHPQRVKILAKFMPNTCWNGWN